MAHFFFKKKSKAKGSLLVKTWYCKTYCMWGPPRKGLD